METVEKVAGAEAQPETKTGVESIGSKLQRAVDVTRKEMDLVLELEAVAALKKESAEEIVNQFASKFAELPHFSNGSQQPEEYIFKLLKESKTNEQAFLDKVEELQKFLTKTTKDLEMLDKKYSVNP
jgi:type VI protein secretion system component VasK